MATRRRTVRRTKKRGSPKKTRRTRRRRRTTRRSRPGYKYVPGFWAKTTKKTRRRAAYNEEGMYYKPRTKKTMTYDDEDGYDE
jgi:hypothetical protein